MRVSEVRFVQAVEFGSGLGPLTNVSAKGKFTEQDNGMLIVVGEQTRLVPWANIKAVSYVPDAPVKKP